jgi:nucleoid-associated protein YgaU
VSLLPGRYSALGKLLGPRRTSARSRTAPPGAQAQPSEASSSERYLDSEPLELADGSRRIAYSRRRFLPQGRLMPVAQEVTVVESDRLDLIAWRTLGDTEQYWRIADANDALDPAALTAVPGRRLRIPLPEAGTGWTPPGEEPALE